MAIERIQVRRGASSAWTAANPVLAAGEFGLAVDTGLLKVGDGVTAWSSLPAANDAGVASLINNAASATRDAGDAVYSPLTVGGKQAVRKDALFFNVKDYGALGDKTTDDTAAIQSAIDAAKAYVVANNTDRFQAGATVYFPRGAYKLTAGLTVDTSCITLAGDSHSGAVLYAPNAAFTLLTFDHATVSLYNCGIRDLRFNTGGNATAGWAVKVSRAIYFVAENIIMNGTFGGLWLDGVAKAMVSKLIVSQETRTAGTNTESLKISSGAFLSGDVHLSDVQLLQTVGTHATNSMTVTGVDGLYVTQLHMHGGLNINPSNTGNETTVASMFFTNCYFDASSGDSVGLNGTAATAYRNIKFTSCYFRDPDLIGLRVEALSVVRYLTLSNCRFSAATRNAIDVRNTNLAESLISECTFDGNNTANSASWGDVQINGEAVSIQGCIFTGGGALGYALATAAAAVDTGITNIDLTNSTVATKVSHNNNATNVYKGIRGWVVKAKGNASVGAGVTTHVVTHGMNLTPTLNAIQLTPQATSPAYWVTTPTSTQFTINFASATAGAFTMGWLVDMEG